MPQPTNAEKRVARVQRLVSELQSKTALNTEASRARAIAICRELIEHLKAENDFQHGRAAVVRLPEQSSSADDSSDGS